MRPQLPYPCKDKDTPYPFRVPDITDSDQGTHSASQNTHAGLLKKAFNDTSTSPIGGGSKFTEMHNRLLKELFKLQCGKWNFVTIATSTEQPKLTHPGEAYSPTPMAHGSLNRLYQQ